MTVCTTDACERDARLPPPGREEAATGGVEVHVFPNLANRLAYDWQLFAPIGLARFLARAGGSFDVAHLHACHNLPVAAAARRLRRLGVPYVVAPNGTAPRIERRRAAKWVFDATLGRGLLAGAARVLAVSEAERGQLAALGVDPALIRTVPNPVDLEEHDARAPDPAAFLRRAGLAPGSGIVLYLGKLTPRKRVDRLVEAFSHLRAAGDDVRLVVAGNDMGSGRSLRALVARHDLSSRVTFTGLLRGPERLDALAAAAVVVYPGRDEVFGLVALEALLAGTPVVVANDSGLGEVVAAVGGGLVVDTAHPAAIAGAIRELRSRPAAWRAAAAAAAGRIRERFAIPVIAARLEEVYSEITGGAA